MLTVYQLSVALGFTLVMDVCIIIAIIIGKKVPSWIIYGIGVGLTALSLVGNAIGGSSRVGLNAIVSLIFAIIGFILIRMRIEKKAQ